MTSALNQSQPARLGVLMVGNFMSAWRRSRGFCEDMAERLAANGWVVIQASRKKAPLARLSDMIITAWMRRNEYDIAHVDVFSGRAFLWAEAACWTLRRAGKPYVLTLRGGNLPAFARRWPWRVRHLLCSATAVTTPSRYLLEQMKPHRADLHLLPNAIDLSAYRFRLRNQPQAHLVWLRAFHEIYNPSLAPELVALLAIDFPNIQMAMVGPSKGDGSLERMQEAAIGLGIANRINLPGWVPKEKVPDWMDKGDIFVNTTNVDNTPVSVLEAMACGLCIVSTNVGGIPYLLEHERDALLVPPNDPQAMASAVRRILTEPGLAQQLSRNARVKVERFSWEHVLPLWENLLESAVLKPNALIRT